MSDPTPLNVHWLSGAVRLFATTERLPCELTPEEWTERAEEAAKLHGMIEAAEIEEKARRAEHKAQVDELKAERDRLFRQVRDHAEIRPVDVAGHGVLETNEVVTVRLDTRAVIARRAMDADERARASQPDLPLAKGGDSGGPIVAGEDALAMLEGQHPEGMGGTDDADDWRWTVTAEGARHPDGRDFDEYLLELHDLDDLNLHAELALWRKLPQDETVNGRADAIDLIRELLGDDLDDDAGDDLPPEPVGIEYDPARAMHFCTAEGCTYEIPDEDMREVPNASSHPCPVLEDNDSEAGEPPTLDDLATWCGKVVEGMDTEATREDMLGWFEAAGQTIPRGLPKDRVKAATRLLEVARAAIQLRGEV